MAIKKLVSTLRPFVAMLILVAIGIGCIMFAVDPTASEKFYGRLLVWLFVSALVFGGVRLWRRPRPVLLALICVALLTWPFIVLARSFKNFDFLVLLFHFQFGLDGATMEGFYDEILAAFIACALFVFAAYGLRNIFNFGSWVIWVSCLIMFAANPLVRNMIENPVFPVKSDLAQRIVQPVVRDNPIKPDIIVIYLEGLEQTFGRTDVFGDIYAGLLPIRAQGVTFTNINQIEATGWSLAGLVASQCGLPLVPNGFRRVNKFTEQVEFMGAHTCLGDVTKEHGYDNHFVVGGTKTFGGIDHFLETHGIAQVTDIDVMSALYPEADLQKARTEEVLDDQMVFDTAATIYDVAVQKDTPLMLMVETFGAHGKTAIVSRDCTSDGQAGWAPNIRVAVACNIEIMQPFVDHIARNNQSRPTVVIVLSDHLNHIRMDDLRIAPADRKNTAFIYSLNYAPPVGEVGQVIDRPASMMDIYPTILAYSGLSGADASGGLGMSLFSDAPTLIEDRGMELLNKQLFPNAALSGLLWARRE